MSAVEQQSPWPRFFSEPLPSPIRADCVEAIQGRTLLVTGAGGWIASALCTALAAHGAEHLLLLDIAEGALYEAHRQLSQQSTARVTPILGSVCDAVLVESILARFMPAIVYHAAAYKHVPLAEANPFVSMQNNVLGTETLLAAAAAHKVQRVVMVSTDKAVAPASIMGASKRMGELVLFRHSVGGTMRAVRLGNVFGSPGSVAPLFRAQVASGGPVNVTHPEARRYFMTQGEVTQCLLAALCAPSSSALLVPELGAPLLIADLARWMIGDSAVPLAFSGLRPGDKMEESLLGREERYGRRLVGGLLPVESPQLPPDVLDELLQGLRSGIKKRDLQQLVITLRRAIPNYSPSASILQQLEPSWGCL